MRLFTYIISHDTGFAPNPYHGFCTLACCKPAIRRSAEQNDWIAGISPKGEGNKLVYAMQVSEKVTFNEYWIRKEFLPKRAKMLGSDVERCGDNIYEPLTTNEFKQHESCHSSGMFEDIEQKRRDLSGKFVLVSRDYRYLGHKAVCLPSNLMHIVPQRGHRSSFDEKTVRVFISFVKSMSLVTAVRPRSTKRCR